ncbi:hypothetical protein SUGI_0384630 [Cryptomeria japonica]|nr:hypothetical protein SUGI_0384630 [Cryptomeria japonica]
MAVEHRKQFELSISNQKKEIESYTMPFLHELIEGDDGGAQDTTNAIYFVSQPPLGSECRGNCDIPGKTSIPPIVSVSNNPLETKVEDEGEQNPTTPTELKSGDIDGDMGHTISPSYQTIGNVHGIGPFLRFDDFEVIFLLKLDLDKFDRWIKEGAATVYIRELSHRFTWERDEPGKAAFEQALMAFMRHLERRQIHMEIIQEEADLICEHTSHPHKHDILDGRVEVWQDGNLGWVAWFPHWETTLHRMLKSHFPRLMLRFIC